MEQAVWRRSKKCASSACVEVAETSDTMLVRDSKLSDSPILTFANKAWNSFVTALKNNKI